jgi:hypothetical protein
MLELFATIIFFIGFFGMSVIILRKIPVLVELPIQEIERPKILKIIKERIKADGRIKSFSGDVLLQKALSRIRVLILKTDSKTSDWLAKLRQKSIKKKENFSDNYWQKLKKK